MTEQIPFGTDSFAENPEPRCPCVLLLDTSGSMRGRPIEALNAGLVTFKDELVADSLAAKRVEVAVITFGPVAVTNDFQIATQFEPTPLQAGGDTPMGAAILQAFDVLKARKELYKSNGVSYYRPWIFLLTDGAPTDSWSEAARRVREGEASKSFAFFAVGTQDADFGTLKKVSVRDPLRLDGLRFRDLFQWLSSSMKSVSRSTPGDEVPLTNPTAPGGWASV